MNFRQPFIGSLLWDVQLVQWYIRQVWYTFGRSYDRLHFVIRLGTSFKGRPELLDEMKPALPELLTHSVEALDDHGHPLSTSHTHGFEAEGLISSLEAVEQRGHDAGTGHSVGVPQGDRSAVDIELLPRDPQVPGRRDHLGGKVFVDFIQVDVVDRHARSAQSLAAGFNRPQSPDLGIDG